MRFEIQILGCGSALPTLGRNSGGQVINLHEQFYLFDCGEGTQNEMRKHKVKFQRLNHIFISHLHGDHFFGLIGLISTLNLLGRQGELTIYGPADLKEILEIQMQASDTYLRFKLNFVATQAKEKKLLFENKTTEVYSFPLKHRIACTGFLIKEKLREKKIKPESIKAYQIPRYYLNKIKKGEHFTTKDGKVIPNNELTIEDKPPRSYAYCSDTIYFEDIAKYIQGVDLLYHESTFLESLKTRAKQTFHSTAKEAAQIAKLTKAKKLILGHYSARYKDLTLFLDEAKEVFENTEIGYDGKIIPIDFD
ncbi:MAG: ribonuclease Z [Flavobacteriales bacterium]